MTPKTPVKSCSLPRMIAYASGEGANSLILNGVFAFALIYYTKALGLEPFWAGLAMSVSMLWEALSEPLMGHISDNTRCRWGRRHPYMIFGGLLMSLCGYLIWAVPESFRGHPTWIFCYLVAINLLLRTAVTLFFIPYLALGFEICHDYLGRSRVQSLRLILNLAVNFAGPAMAWTLFFQDRPGVSGTTVPANYLHMGTAFSLATAAFVLIVVAATFHFIEDTRLVTRPACDHRIRDFFRDLSQIVLNPDSRWVTGFIFFSSVGMAWSSALQIFVYDDFMKFPAPQKTIAHGGTMVGMALGALLSTPLAKRFDKRGTVLLGGLTSLAANGMLALIFLTGILPPGTLCHVGAQALPLASILFVVFHASYWLGMGIMLPNATAMMADAAEIHLLQTGIKQDGGYASVFSLAGRLGSSLGLLISGYGLRWIGYQVGGTAVKQSSLTLWGLGLVTFLGGILMCLAALLVIWNYPVTQDRLNEIRTGKLARNP